LISAQDEQPQSTDLEPILNPSPKQRGQSRIPPRNQTHTPPTFRETITHHGEDQRGKRPLFICVSFPSAERESLLVKTFFYSNAEPLEQKLAALRAEADVAIERAETAEGENKKLKQALLEREQEIKSKDHRLDDLEAKFEEASAKLKETTERCVLVGRSPGPSH